MYYSKIISIVMAGAIFLAGVGLTGCSKQQTAKESALTVGMAKKYIYPKKTTQVEVLEIFGPPDLVTRKESREVWTYDKISHDVVGSSGFLTVLIAGYGKSRARSSSISTMLIIYYDKNDIVEDYAMSVSKF